MDPRAAPGGRLAARALRAVGLAKPIQQPLPAHCHYTMGQHTKGPSHIGIIVMIAAAITMTITTIVTITVAIIQ